MGVYLLQKMKAKRTRRLLLKTHNPEEVFQLMAHKLIKPVMSAEEAVQNVKPGSSLMVGGFNYAGVPYTLIDALVVQGTKELHLISNDTLYANDQPPRGSRPRDAGGERPVPQG